MKPPEIREVITTESALDLCKHFELNYLIERINLSSTLYQDWEFDGISGLNDKFAASITGADLSALTLECALPHDLRYGYGERGNKKERKEADLQFKQDLMAKAKMNKFWATVFYLAVRAGGAESWKLPFSWAFAQK